MMTLTLAGHATTLDEPVFKQLKIIITAYNQLVTATDDGAQQAALNTLLSAATQGRISLKQLKAGELEAFLAALPELCQLKPIDAGKPGKPFDWGYLYAHLSSTYGWTYDGIDNGMTLSKLNEYDRYQRENPPTHLLVKAFMGYEYQDQQAGSAFLAAIAAQAKAARLP